MNLNLKVRNYHIDSYGHVNNAQYLTFLEEARTVFLERMGYSLGKLRGEGIFIFITEINVKYLSPAELEDDLRFAGWFNELATRRATWQHEIVNLNTGKQVLTGTVSGMFLKAGKVSSIPKEIRKTLSQLYIPA